jgi:ribosomal protein S18 acetylase RimI-like enzyme
MEITVAAVDATDIPDVHAALTELATWEGSPTAVTATYDQLQTALLGVEAALHGLVARAGTQFAGCLIWEPTFSSWSCTRTARLHDLYVLTEHRSAGVGRALLRRGLQDVRQAGRTRLDLWVRADNVSAQRFYRAAGGSLLDGSQDWRFELGRNPGEGALSG